MAANLTTGPSVSLPRSARLQRGAAARRLAAQAGRLPGQPDLRLRDPDRRRRQHRRHGEVAERAAASMPDTVQLRVLTHHQNQGKGAAVKTGCLAAAGDYVHVHRRRPGEPPRGLRGHRRRPSRVGADVAVGTRVQPGGYDMRSSQPWTRRLMGRALHLLPQAPAPAGHRGHPVPAQRASAARPPSAYSPPSALSGWSFDVEILYLARRFGMKTVQIPVRWEHVGGSTLQDEPADGAARLLGPAAAPLPAPARAARQETGG